MHLFISNATLDVVCSLALTLDEALVRGRVGGQFSLPRTFLNFGR